MLAGVFHEGSGLGDQLFRYITVRTLADEKGFHSAMFGDFKGDFFLEQPEKCHRAGLWGTPFFEKDVRDAQGNDIRSYDPEINFVQDNTIIDGSFEDSKYWGHNLDNINKWLEVEPLEVPDNKCVIGFRGGEYATQAELFLPRQYFYEGMEEIIELNLRTHFQIHTDDSNLARKFFEGGMLSKNFEFIENQKISHSKHSNMGFNWRSARYAKYAIIPNSAFFILPRLLKHHEDPTAVTIAPRYWARRNTNGPWRPAAYYKQFTYI